VHLSFRGQITHREIVEQICFHAHTPIPLESLSPALGSTMLSRGGVVFDRPGNSLARIAAEHGLKCWVSEKGLSIGASIPPGSFRVRAHDSAPSYWDPLAEANASDDDESRYSVPRPGRPLHRPPAFVQFAGELWAKAIAEKRRVSDKQLRHIAARLDAIGFLPPAHYLEGKCARDLKDFNSRHSNSKVGPIMTWTKLVSHGEKDHKYGMRRLLSRCAELFEGAPRLSGN
jgi:hypothetical protein